MDKNDPLDSFLTSHVVLLSDRVVSQFDEKEGYDDDQGIECEQFHEDLHTIKCQN